MLQDTIKLHPPLSRVASPASLLHHQIQDFLGVLVCGRSASCPGHLHVLVCCTGMLMPEVSLCVFPQVIWVVRQCLLGLELMKCATWLASSSFRSPATWLWDYSGGVGAFWPGVCLVSSWLCTKVLTSPATFPDSTQEVWKRKKI